MTEKMTPRQFELLLLAAADDLNNGRQLDSSMAPFIAEVLRRLAGGWDMPVERRGSRLLDPYAVLGHYAAAWDRNEGLSPRKRRRKAIIAVASRYQVDEKSVVEAMRRTRMGDKRLELEALAEEFKHFGPDDEPIDLDAFMASVDELPKKTE
jgi:hypothetical protein